MEGIRICIAEDNTTAVAAINALFYAKDPSLCAEFMILFDLLKGASVEVWYVPTDEQPADEPSRDKPLNDEKCKKCWHFLNTNARRSGSARENSSRCTEVFLFQPILLYF